MTSSAIWETAEPARAKRRSGDSSPPPPEKKQAYPKVYSRFFFFAAFFFFFLVFFAAFFFFAMLSSQMVKRDCQPRPAPAAYRYADRSRPASRAAKQLNNTLSRPTLQRPIKRIQQLSTVVERYAQLYGSPAQRSLIEPLRT